MKKSLLPSFANVKDYAGLLSKSWQFSVILLFLFLNSLSAQETQTQEPVSSGLIITAGDAVIYSKDASFNEQISKSKTIQQYSKVIKINNDELKIVAKNSDEPTKKLQPKIKDEVDLLAAKKLKDSRKVDLPKKKIDLHISKGYSDGKFLAGVSSINGSFVPPSNDYHYSKYFLNSSANPENTSLIFLHFTSCFYKNDNSRLQINVSSFSVRPPPADLI